MTHPFLDSIEHRKLKIFARILHDKGEMQAVTDDGLILLEMFKHGLPKPEIVNGDLNKVLMFSDAEWSWLVVAFQDGLSALKIKRDYLMKEFCPLGTFSKERAKKITDGMLCLMTVDPRRVDFEVKGFK